MAKAPSRISKIDTAWRTVLQQPSILHDLDADGFSLIPFALFRTLGLEPDARLLVKLDSKAARPKVFLEKNLSLFPVDNQTVALIKGTAPYITIDPARLRHLKRFPRYVDEKNPSVVLDSLSAAEITSEGDLILVMQNARIMSMIHQAHEGKVAIAGGGRHRSPPGVTHTVALPNGVGKTVLTCEKVQFELDAVHESDDVITMAEAKIIPSRSSITSITSVHLRQILFPTLWLRHRMAQKGSKKRVVPAIILAQQNKHNKAQWDIFWLPVIMTLHNGAVEARVAWKQAIFIALDGNAKPERQPKPRNLHTLEPATKAQGASFPQFNNLGVLDKIAYNIGHDGISTDDITPNQLRDLRRGQWAQHAHALAPMIQPVAWNDALGAIHNRHTWCARQHAYMRDALEWLGFIAPSARASTTVQPTPLAVSYARCDRDVQIQTLWNIIRTSRLAQAAVAGMDYASVPEAWFVADGVDKASATGGRRYQSIRQWIAFIAPEVAAYADGRFQNVPRSWFEPEDLLAVA